MSYNKLIQDFGLSRTMLARMFLMDPSNFSKSIQYGFGRSLTKRASEFLAQATKVAADLGPPDPSSDYTSILLSDKNERIPILENQIRKSESELLDLQGKLLHAKTEHEAMEKRHWLFRTMMDDETFPLLPLEQAMLKACDLDLLIKMQKYGPLAQEMLENDIAILEFKLSSDKALLEKMKTT